MTQEITSLRIAFIGFGEVGQRFARDFSTKTGVSMTAFDLQFLAGANRDGMLARTSELGVLSFPSSAEACRGAEVVVSAVTADQTEKVAQEAAIFLRPGQIFFDVNSASPETKRRAARAIEARGAAYVEAAVMAAVRKPGIAVPILAGGRKAEETAARLNVLGMRITPVSTEHGRASAIKLCRSIMIKGIEALMVDCSKAVGHFGVAPEVYGSLSETFPSIDWPRLAGDMNERVATHGVRRAAEMREAADMLLEAGFDSALARAVADAQERGAKVRH